MEIDRLDLDVKTYNRLKKAGFDTTDELLSKIYEPEGIKVISQPDMKRIETAMKDKGIIKYMRGDYVTEDDIEPEPLTWDELHGYIGKLVVFDCSTESHKWLKVNWIYDIQDDGEGTVICSDGSKNYSYIRRATVNSGYNSRNPEYLSRHECLKYAGRMFALKSEEVKAVSETQIMSAEYTKAVTLTKKIKANAAAAQESLWEVCKGLKEMHDGKLYKELGYQNFEEYTENEVGIMKVQAYKYVAIGGMENVHSSEHFEQIGVTKLALLAKLDEPQREEIQQNVDVESVTVKELKKRIAEIQNSNAILQGNITNELEKSAKLQAQLESKHREWLQACDEKTSYAQQLFHAEENLNEAKDTIQSLEKQIEELEDRPVDVAVQANDAEIDKLTAQFQEELAKRDKDTERRLNEQLQRHKEELRKQREQLEKEAEAADVEVEEEIREKAELDIQVKFATDALRRIARWLMSVNNENYTHYAMKKINEVLELINKEEK